MTVDRSAMTLYEQAEEMRLSLMMKIVRKEDVIAWADHLIEIQSNPPSWLLDVSLAANESVRQVEDRLREAPRDGDPQRVARETLKRFVKAWGAKEFDASSAAYMLQIWAAAAKIDQDSWTQAMIPSWILDDAQHGIYSLADVTKAVNDCLAELLTGTTK